MRNQYKQTERSCAGTFSFGAPVIALSIDEHMEFHLGLLVDICPQASAYQMNKACGTILFKCERNNA
jgi:hypothetical protein